jgi:hypothetical protein
MYSCVFGVIFVKEFEMLQASVIDLGLASIHWPSVPSGTLPKPMPPMRAASVVALNMLSACSSFIERLKGCRLTR